MATKKPRLRLVRTVAAPRDRRNAPEERGVRFQRHAALLEEWHSFLQNQIVPIALECRKIASEEAAGRTALVESLRRALSNLSALHMTLTDVLLDVPPRVPRKRREPPAGYEPTAPEASA